MQTFSWTLKDRGKNGIWGQKDLALEELIPKRSFLVLADQKKYPKKIVLNPQKVKKGAETVAHYMYRPNLT